MRCAKECETSLAGSYYADDDEHTLKLCPCTCAAMKQGKHSLTVGRVGNPLFE